MDEQGEEVKLIRLILATGLFTILLTGSLEFLTGQIYNLETDNTLRDIQNTKFATYNDVIDWFEPLLKQGYTAPTHGYNDAYLYYESLHDTNLYAQLVSEQSCPLLVTDYNSYRRLTKEDAIGPSNTLIAESNAQIDELTFIKESLFYFLVFVQMINIFMTIRLAQISIPSHKPHGTRVKSVSTRVAGTVRVEVVRPVCKCCARTLWKSEEHQPHHEEGKDDGDSGDK